MALRIPQKELAPGVLEARNAALTLERELIFGMAKFYHFYRQMRDTICPYDATAASYRQDFSIAKYNSLYQELDIFYRRFDHKTDLKESFGIPMTHLAAYVVDRTNRGGLPADIGQQLVEEIEQETKYIADLQLVNLTAMVEGVQFNAWLTTRVTTQAMTELNNQKQFGLLTLENMDSVLAKARSATASTRNDLLIRGDAFFDADRTIMPFIEPSNFPKLAKALGGGFFWGESTMIAAINAGGKTVLMMQLAKDFAEAGYKVVFFTTERKPEELFVRSLSNHLSVPLDRLFATDRKSPLTPTKIPYIPPWIKSDPELSRSTNELKKLFGENLLFVDWSRGQGLNVLSAFESTMAQIDRAWCSPHIVFFDWVGGGIDACKDPEHRRHLFTGTANLLTDHGKRTNRHMFMAAQLDKAKVKGSVSYIDLSMISESKGMADNLTNFIGLTTMTDKKIMGDNSAINKYQYMCLPKCSHGHTGQVIPVELQYQFQRLVESSVLRS